MDVDLKMASRVKGIDAILGVLGIEVRNGKIADFRYKLLPVFANLPWTYKLDKARMYFPR